MSLLVFSKITFRLLLAADVVVHSAATRWLAVIMITAIIANIKKYLDRLAQQQRRWRLAHTEWTEAVSYGGSGRFSIL